MGYWHMQLHPNDLSNYTREDILGLVKNEGVIGIGESWIGDHGQPSNFKNVLKEGDIVLIRHNGPLCLVRVIGSCFENPNQTQVKAWFYFCRRVVILDENGKEMADKFQKETKKSWNNNIYLPDTLGHADKCEFIKFWYQEILKKEQIEKMQKVVELLKLKKNIILQGAPGTGKTYTTAELALSICDGIDKVPNSHKKVMECYEKLQQQGQIGFITFHQSMDYEDFVEGIKPVLEKNVSTDKNEVSYKISPGIFKSICGKAEKELLSSFDNAWNKLLGEIEKSSGNPYKLTTVKQETEFGLEINKNDGLTICTGKDFTEKNVGSITKDNLRQFWQNKYDGDGRSSYYEGVLAELTNKYNLKNYELKNYVLIIDEINRGNVSKIFGELITLLEADKRKLVGVDDSPENQEKQHTIELTLPYSKEKFSVPSNLYIIGTMNTTDRSVGSIDYAVRRRFSFVTLEANRSKIEDENAKKLFDSVKHFLNKSKYDMDIEDLMVGHSYFMDAANLQMKWQYEILPLLMEYHKDGIIKESPLKVFSEEEAKKVKLDYNLFIEKWSEKKSEEA